MKCLVMQGIHSASKFRCGFTSYQDDPEVVQKATNTKGKGFWGDVYLLSQWLNFKLFGITYLVGKIKFKLFFQGPLAE